MDALALFGRVRKQWPLKVDLSDGVPAGKSGYLFPTLSGTWGQIEQEWESSEDELMQLGIWTYFQTAHEAASEAHQAGETVLRMHELEVGVFEYYLLKNLEDPSWASFRNELDKKVQ